MHCPFRVHVKEYSRDIYPGVVKKLPNMPKYSIVLYDNEVPWNSYYLLLTLPKHRFMLLPTTRYKENHDFAEEDLQPRSISALPSFYYFRTIDEQFIDIIKITKVPPKFYISTGYTGTEWSLV